MTILYIAIAGLVLVALVNFIFEKPRSGYPKSPTEQDLLDSVNEGDMVKAIYCHRSLTGAALLEAKEYVEGLFSASAALTDKPTAKPYKQQSTIDQVLVDNIPRITHGLIIAEPYISLILAGKKDWEMRSTQVSRRGWIALIEKGSGTVIGVANLIGSIGPLTEEKMLATQDHHQLAEVDIRDPKKKKWRIAWVLESATRLPTPVPYTHPSGAVIWVKLENAVCSEVHALWPTR